MIYGKIKMIDRAQMREKMLTKTILKEENGNQENLQQSVEIEGAKTIAQSNACEWKTAPLSSNSYSQVVASIPPEFIFKPFQSIVELAHGQKQEIYNEQSS